MLRTLLASMCVVMSLLFSGCGPIPVTPVGRPTIYAFLMPGCSGCVRDKARVDQLESRGHTVIRVDIIVQPEFRRRFRVDAVPLYLVVVNGTVVLRTHDLNLVIQMVQCGCSVQEEAAVSQLP